MTIRSFIATVIIAGATFAVSATAWSQAERSARGEAPRSARAVSLVLQKIFVENPTIVRGVDPGAWSGDGGPRSWRVQRSGESEVRFDVTYSVRGKALCVWRVDVDARRVQPTDCNLEAIESPPA